LWLLVLAAGFNACQKADKFPFYGEGTAPVLSASAATVAPVPADSLKVALVLNWTDPGHAQDSSLYKFVVEIDSVNGNFNNAVKKVVTGTRSYSFLARDFNALLLSWGFQFNVAYNVFIRVTSSYGNNNERLSSNVLTIRGTPYKIPPKVTLPPSGRLFIVGGATEGGWNNPIPSAFAIAQEFSRVDETTFGGIFNLSSGQNYLVLPVNGSWDSKYALPTTNQPNVEQEGNFAYYAPGVPGGDDFRSVATSGQYKITLDFQQGRYKVEPFLQQHGLPAQLFIVGGATPGGWNNPVPLPQQQLTRRNSVLWDVTLNFTSGQAYLILPTNGDWGRKFGAQDAGAPGAGLGGNFVPEGADFPAPATSGSYKFSIDFFTGKYKLTQ
ncbi:MAG TPA: SusE domain-containing protein, partial [Lacibacter sp.]|nr:SusE domain-containing protein [Lacibacter sp.]